MSDNESEPRADAPEEHFVLDPMPVFDSPVEDTGAPHSPDEDDTSPESATPGPAPQDAPLDTTDPVLPQATTTSGDTDDETTDPAASEPPTDTTGLDTTGVEAPDLAVEASAPAPALPDGPLLDEPADTAVPPNPEDPSAQMWASVRDRTPTQAATEDRLEEPTPAITGEEVSLTSEEDASEIVGDVDSSQLETGTIEPVPTATSRIPVITPSADARDSGAAPQQPTPVDTAVDDTAAQADSDDGRTDLPAPPPRDVLENRRTSAEAPDIDTVDAREETPGAPEAADALIEPSALDETSVQRRSLMVPASPELDPQATETSWHPRSEDLPGSRATSTPASLDDALFEGSTVVPVVPSRTGAHLWSLFLFVILVPVAWFALADAGARMTLATDAPMVTGTLNFAALLELLGGILVVVVLALLVMRSSLGAHVTGILVTLLGIPWVVAPGWTARTALPLMDWLNSWNAFGQNIAHHLQSSGYSGRLLVLGVVLLLVGLVSHRVRRRGRAEESMRAEVERVNPAGAHLTARARRAAAKAQRDSGR